MKKVYLKKVFLDISQNSQENSYEFCGIFKNNFFTEHPRTAASIDRYNFFQCSAKNYILLSDLEKLKNTGFLNKEMSLKL